MKISWLETSCGQLIINDAWLIMPGDYISGQVKWGFHFSVSSEAASADWLQSNGRKWCKYAISTIPNPRPPPLLLSHTQLHYLFWSVAVAIAMTMHGIRRYYKQTL